jgi:hypothetical protein
LDFEFTQVRPEPLPARQEQAAPRLVDSHALNEVRVIEDVHDRRVPVHCTVLSPREALERNRPEALYAERLTITPLPFVLHPEQGGSHRAAATLL